MSTVQKILVINSLIPQEVISVFEGSESPFNELKEKAMISVVSLVANTVLGAIKAFNQRDFVQFDANPGDFACQNRALILRQLPMEALSDECLSLSGEVNQIYANILDRKKTREIDIPTSSFFQQQLGDWRVSKELEYIILCYLSHFLMIPNKILPNGVITEKSDVKQLELLSEDISTLNEAYLQKIKEENQKNLSQQIVKKKQTQQIVKKKQTQQSVKKKQKDPSMQIVEENKKFLSLLSVKMMHDLACQVTSLSLNEKELMETMLSSKYMHQYKSKFFGCLFYEVKTVLMMLRQLQGIVCLTSIVPSGTQRFHILLQSPEPGEEFAVLDEHEELPRDALTVVFEAVVKDNSKILALEAIKKDGFSKIILAQAAKEPPYEPNSKLEAITSQDAITEIKKINETPGLGRDLFKIDHVFLNCLDKELKRINLLVV
ncbi:MAG: hypothetical protein WCP39_05420 [Chlamydiota bacterium]